MISQTSEAVLFLASRRSEDGLWRDFRTVAGEGIDWPSSFIGLQLVHAGWDRADLLRTAHALIGRQHDDGGWGYHAEVPTDADTTAHVLLFLMALGYHDASVGRAAACLARHQDPDSGGVHTYARPNPILRYMRLGAHVRLSGWCSAHLEVTATAGRAFAALGSEYATEAQAAWHYVRERQRDDGSWSAYWWTSRHYPTLEAVELAAAMHDSRVVRRAAAWVRSLQRRDGSWCHPGSAFATALSLSVLAVAGRHKRCRERATNSLNAMRESDGAWPAHAEMRIPPPWVIEPDDCRAWRVDGLGTGAVLHDQNRLFTTALCLGALARTEGEP